MMGRRFIEYKSLQADWTLHMIPPQYDKQATQKEFDEGTSLSNSIYWLKAIIEQGARIFNAAAEPVVHMNSDNDNSRSRMEEQFFLTACEKAQRWIKPMKLTTKEAIKFSALRPDINLVRNEREHDDERYGLGNQYEVVDVSEHARRGFVLKRPSSGRKNPNPHHKFQMKKADTVGGVTVVGSMSGTTYSGDRILLGGIVDVALVVNAAEALIGPLLKEHQAYWGLKLGTHWKSDEHRVEVLESYRIRIHF